MKQNLHSRFIICAFVISLCFSTIGKAQSPTFNCYFTNDIFISPTVFQFDIYFLRTGPDPFEFASGQFGIILNSACLNSGLLVPSIVSSSCQLTNTSQCITSISAPLSLSTVNIAGRIPPGAGNGSLISNVKTGCTSPGTRLATIKITSTVAFPCQCMNPSFNFVSATGQTQTKIFAYVGGLNTDITANGTFYNYNTPASCVVHCGSNGVGELKGFNPVVVYPNPASTQITISAGAFHRLTKPATVSVQNVLGETVRTEQRNLSEDFVMDIKTLPAGIYFVKVEDGEDVWLGRFVKE